MDIRVEKPDRNTRIWLRLMGLDWGIQRIGLLESTNPRRFLTGICGGIGTAFFYTRIFSLILKGIGVI